MISVNRFITADDTDALANTDLAQIPGSGLLVIYIASTQNDTQVTVTGPNIEPAGRLIRVVQRTNGVPNMSDDEPFVLPVSQGGKYVLNVDIVTAATVGIFAKFAHAYEL